MNCDLCDKPAVVHEVTVRNGTKNELHLCEDHASAAGIATPGQQAMDQFLSPVLIPKGTQSARTARRKRKSKVCESCGMSLAHFRTTGVLGCAECYEAFEEQLGPMIEQAQNGGTSHAGKCPRRGGESIERQLQIRRLISELEAAVSAEQFERAAELRDELHDLEADLPRSQQQRERQDQA